MNVVVLTMAKSRQWLVCGTAQRLTCAECDKEQSVEMSWNSWFWMLIDSPGSHFCGLCQATVCRDELTYCQIDMCSQIELDVQSRDLFVRIMTSNSLQKWADSWTDLNAGMSAWHVPKEPYLRTLSSNSLQRGAHKWTTVNATVLNECLTMATICTAQRDICVVCNKQKSAGMR